MAKIKANEIVEDIRSGCSDAEIMAKYNLKEASLPVLYGKLIDAGRLSQTDLDQRTKTVDCPACGFAHDPNLDICPRCSVVKEKYLAKKEREEETPSPPPIHKPKDPRDDFVPAIPFARIGAFVLDYLILWVLVLVPYMIADALVRGGTHISMMFLSLSVILIDIIIVLFYFAFCESHFNGQTIGKKAFHIKVVTNEGIQPSFYHALVRLFFSGISLFLWSFFLFTVLGLILFLIFDRIRIFDDEKRMYQDRATGTWVISADA